MTDLERSVLIGMCIGDGCLTKRQNALKIYHSTKQRDYLEYKKALVEKILCKKINTCECTHKHYSGTTYYTCGFTVSHPFFKNVYDMIYPDGVKRFTKELLEALTPQSIAIWYMDDGSHSAKRNVDGKPTACQMDFSMYTSKEQCELVRDFFFSKYNIKVNIRNTGSNKEESKKYSISANTENSKKIFSLIGDFVIDSMKYKFRFVYPNYIESNPIATGQCSCGRSLFSSSKGTSSLLCKKCRNRISNQKQSDLSRLNNQNIPS